METGRLVGSVREEEPVCAGETAVRRPTVAAGVHTGLSRRGASGARLAGRNIEECSRS
ncbi:hypothetical protein EDF59_10270 [Novosphingobium sp. ST904]|nr:hypothetical protein EDF59_10270 [Novosphingobium sp. ST904]